jgi:cell division protease FtsH
MATIKKQTNNKRNNAIALGIIIIFIGIFIALSSGWLSTNTIEEYSYTEFISEIENGTITADIDVRKIANDINLNSYELSGQLSDTKSFVVYVPNDTAFDLVQTAADSEGLTLNYNPESNLGFLDILWIIMPILLIVVVIFVFMRQNSGGNNRAFDFGKSRATLNRQKTTTYKNVAGLDEEKEELEEIIDFLKNPKKYTTIGARIPKGILLMGSPGTGKTLLARATAGEAKVPFYTTSGSEFLEMFVGVGASRVRDMFKVAKQNAPCIVFIDEIDAVGRQRGTGLGGGHDEREQTLNQLLVEMDGFGPNSGVIVMAATNRPDVLDPALLRPGRFDRQITIGRPDIKARKSILDVHAKNKKIGPKVKFEEVAKRTPGFTGADLENLLNEAALLAARENKDTIKIYHIDEAIDRVLMGPAKKSRVFTKRERNFIAHHEAGHAVIGLKLANADIVHKVTIIPRGQAGGYAMMLPEEEESFLQTKQGLLDKIVGLLGGRVSEEINFNEVTTGAHNDFQRATQIARAMVTEYGMSKLGPIQYEERGGNVFLGRDYTNNKNFSDAVALEIDTEIREIISECYQKTTDILTENLDLVKLIAEWLLRVETLNKEDIDELVSKGTLEWYDKKQAKEALEKEIKPEEEIKQPTDEN